MNKIYEEIIGLQDRTNINNNNNNNNFNKEFNKINVYGLKDREHEVRTPEATPLSGFSSSQLVVSETSGVGSIAKPEKANENIPEDWHWLKLDLFKNQLELNSQLKLAITIQNNKKEMVRLMSALNSPFRHYKRQIENYKSNKHYQSVQLFVDYLKAEYGILKKYVNVSKVMLRNGKKDGIIPNLSVIHWCLEGKHYITLYKLTNRYTYVLDDDVSHYRSYKANEVLASKMIRATTYKQITMESLGI